MDKLFLSVLNMSLTASFVIAAIMLARLLLKKAPKVISYAMWAVAGFRLAFPFSFESVLSLIPFKAAPIPADIAAQPIPRVDSGIEIVDSVVSGVLPAGAPAASVNPLQIWLIIGSCLWLAGIAVMLAYSVVSVVLLKRRLRGAAHAQADIYEALNLKTPFVLGLFRPKIYIPAGLSEEEKRYIILHERTHIRRRDHLVKILAYFILCLHWFNPLAWAAFLLMGADMEMSCDERVLKEMGGSMKKAYSLSLLSLATERRIIGLSPLAFGEGGMKERIKNVLNFKKPSKVIITVAVTLAAVLSVGFAANKVTGTGDYDFTSFSVNGFMLGADTNEMDTSTFTPVEPLNVGDGYDFNFAGARYSADESTGRLRKMLVGVYDGADIPSLTVYKGQNPVVIPHALNSIEEVTEYLGQGKSGWQDREQRLRYMEYRQKEGRLSATVRFVYTDGESDGINHHLVWVIAESSLPYPVEIKPMTLYDVRELQKKGDALTFDDFKYFKGVDVSSNTNYHIMVYGVEDGYRLIVRSDGEQVDSMNLEEVSADLERSATGWESIEIGTPRETVLKIIGEPDLALSGFYGDGYSLEDGSTVIFYYDEESLLQWIYKDGKMVKPRELIGNADVNRDGREEAFYLDKSHIGEWWVTLRVCDSDGNEIWSEDAATSHVGWNSLFLCEQDGEYYLLRYNPSMFQGRCTYTYTLFTLEGGAEHAVRSNTIEFDVNGENELDAPKMIAFAEEVNALLGRSTLLLSTEGGEFFFGPSSADRFFERYSWVNETPKLYAEGDDLQTRLEKYSEYTVSNRRRQNG